MIVCKKQAWSGLAVVASAAAAVLLLFAGPPGTAHALALSNNLQTTVSLDTNVASGTNAFTTLAPITVTCGVVDITAGVADGVTGVTLVLDAGWTFAGGAAPVIVYAWGGGPTGDAVGTIASPTTIRVDILASCDPGDVITFTGVQVKPLTAASTAAVINADINTADVSSARLAVTAVTPPPEPEENTPPPPAAVATPTPTPVATATPTPVATATPAPVATPAPLVAAPTPSTGVSVEGLVPTLGVTPPGVTPPSTSPPVTIRPPATGNGGLIGADATSQPAVWLLFAASGLVILGRRLTAKR